MTGYLIIENIEKREHYIYNAEILEVAYRMELMDFEKDGAEAWDYCFPGEGFNGKWHIKREDIIFGDENGQLFLDF